MRIYQLFFIIFCCLWLPSCASGRIAQQLEGGKAAFQAAEYKSAFRQLLPLAAEGNAEAQYAVGYMYYYGYGVPQDTMSGLFWMTKAAEKRNRAAVKALDLIHRKPATGVCPPGAAENCVIQKTAIYKDLPMASPTIVPIKSSASYSSQGYVLQLASSADRADIQHIQKNKHLQTATHIWHTKSQGRYVLTYGRYRSTTEANAALQYLPRVIKDFHPWVRPLSQLGM